jgi:Holliday junction DNA helicase RuvA
MITYIKGKLTQAAPGFAVIEIAGIGYKVMISANAYIRLPQTGTETILHTSQVIREISHTLYGFLTQDERDFFEEAMGVSGIGPKIALSLIGHLSLEELHYAICNHDIISISRVPGIGKKTAERLIIEMRDKLAKNSKRHLPSDFAINMDSDPRAQQIADAMNALINLGYNQMAAQKAIKKSLKILPESTDLPTLITDALNHV